MTFTFITLYLYRKKGQVFASSKLFAIRDNPQDKGQELEL